MRMIVSIVFNNFALSGKALLRSVTSVALGHAFLTCPSHILDASFLPEGAVIHMYMKRNRFCSRLVLMMKAVKRGFIPNS